MYAIIIGAGPAGLTAAYCLLKQTDIIPIVLEESTYIGGISRTHNFHGNRMDLGGHRFFSKNDEVMALWRVLMPLQGAPTKDDLLLGREKPLAQGGPDPETSDTVMLMRDRVSRIYYLRKFFDYPIALKWQTLHNLGFVRTIQSGFGYVWARVFKRKELTLKDFMVNRFGMPLYRMFFASYNEKLWGKSPEEIAPDWGAQRIKGLSLSKAVFSKVKNIFTSNKEVETSLIEQFLYPKKGPGQLWERMAEEILRMGGEIHMEQRVTRIATKEGKITALDAASPSGETKTYEGDSFFSSMPIKDLVEALDVTVPAEVEQVARELPYRDFITVGVLVKKMSLQNQTAAKTVGNIVPDCWIYIQEPDVKMGRLQIFNNWSPYMVEDLENTVWIGLEYFCDEGDALWEMTDDAFIQMAVDELAAMNIADKADVLDACRLRVKKAYPAYFGSYSSFPMVREYLDTFDNLYCIGRNGQHRYNNMDHSMLTAMEAVTALQNGDADRTCIWNVNTEEEYHEVKHEV